MRTTVFLGVIATALAVAGATLPALALSQSNHVTSNDSNSQSNSQKASQSAKAMTVSSNVNAPSSWMGQRGSGLNVGATSQDNAQSSHSSTTQSQSSTQSAANFHFSAKSINSSQTAVCVAIARC